MGYQEPYLRVNCLAEIAGIERAVNESEEVKTLEYLVCVCGVRVKQDLHGGSWLSGCQSLSSLKGDEPIVAREGDLFAVVAGARLYQPSDPFLWIDCIVGIGGPEYDTLVEVIPLEKAREEAELRLGKAKEAERFMRRSLNNSYNRAMRGEHPIELPAEFR